MADPQQLGQLFQNLVANAIKFRAEKPPRVKIASETNEKDWKISICDNGIGISQEYADRIFVIFQRLHTRNEYAGTGIGLAICKKVVERHGGAFGSSRRPTEDPRFASRFRLHPVRKSKKGYPMNFESQPQAIDILLVEDNPGDVRLSREVLRDSRSHLLHPRDQTAEGDRPAEIRQGTRCSRS